MKKFSPQKKTVSISKLQTLNITRTLYFVSTLRLLARTVAYVLWSFIFWTWKKKKKKTERRETFEKEKLTCRCTIWGGKKLKLLICAITLRTIMSIEFQMAHYVFCQVRLLFRSRIRQIIINEDSITRFPIRKTFCTKKVLEITFSSIVSLLFFLIRSLVRLKSTRFFPQFDSR